MPAEIRQNTAESAAWSLVAWICRGTPSMSGVMQPGEGPIPVLTWRGGGGGGSSARSL